MRKRQKILAAIVTHKHGSNLYLSRHSRGLTRQLAQYVAGEVDLELEGHDALIEKIWGLFHDGKYKEVVDAYFAESDIHDEYLEILDAEL